MKELTKEELKNINGGMSITAKIFLVGGIISFIIGVMDGFTRPLKCNY